MAFDLFKSTLFGAGVVLAFAFPAFAGPRSGPAPRVTLEAGDGRSRSSGPDAIACSWQPISAGGRTYACCRDFEAKAIRLEFVIGDPSPAELERLMTEWMSDEGGSAFCAARYR